MVDLRPWAPQLMVVERLAVGQGALRGGAARPPVRVVVLGAGAVRRCGRSVRGMGLPEVRLLRVTCRPAVSGVSILRSARRSPHRPRGGFGRSSIAVCVSSTWPWAGPGSALLSFPRFAAPVTSGICRGASSILLPMVITISSAFRTVTSKLLRPSLTCRLLSACCPAARSALIRGAVSWTAARSRFVSSSTSRNLSASALSGAAVQASSDSSSLARLEWLRIAVAIRCVMRCSTWAVSFTFPRLIESWTPTYSDSQSAPAISWHSVVVSTRGRSSAIRSASKPSMRSALSFHRGTSWSRCSHAESGVDVAVVLDEGVEPCGLQVHDHRDDGLRGSTEPRHQPAALAPVPAVGMASVSASWPRRRVLLGLRVVVVRSHCGLRVFSPIALLELGLWLIARFLYFAFWESSSYCATPGARACHLQVFDEVTGDPPTFSQASLRSVCRFFSAALFGLGWLPVFLHPKRRALHDILSGCVVVRHEPQPVVDALLAASPAEAGRVAADPTSFERLLARAGRGPTVPQQRRARFPELAPIWSTQSAPGGFFGVLPAVALHARSPGVSKTPGCRRSSARRSRGQKAQSAPTAAAGSLGSPFWSDILSAFPARWRRFRRGIL